VFISHGLTDKKLRLPLACRLHDKQICMLTIANLLDSGIIYMARASGIIDEGEESMEEEDHYAQRRTGLERRLFWGSH
jgi:hypothetical protein